VAVEEDVIDQLDGTKIKRKCFKLNKRKKKYDNKHNGEENQMEGILFDRMIFLITYLKEE
jgi:hypothetical protein